MARRQRRKALWSALISAIALFGAVLQVAPSDANHDGTVSGVFESKDGNLDNDHAAATPPSVDWNSFTTAATATAWSFQQFGDNVGNPDDIFSGGTKQDQNCPGTKTGSLGGGSGKIDLSRIYLAHQKISGSDFLFVAWGRVDGSDAASSHVAYEFNRGTTPCASGNGLTNRIADDVLIVYDFSGGDADATFKVLRWKTTTGTCEVANHVPPCWGDKLVLTAANADGDVNAGVSVDDDIRGDTLGPVQFGEAGLNLSAIGIDPCDLNGTVMGVSRSSGDSGTAQMKDKVGPGTFTLPGCVQATAITTRVRITDTATITGFDSTFVGDHSGTLTFNLYPPSATENCNTATPVFTSTFSNVATSSFIASGYYEVPLNATGTYRWKVDYTGDSANLPSTSGCGSEVVTINYGF